MSRIVTREEMIRHMNRLRVKANEFRDKGQYETAAHVYRQIAQRATELGMKNTATAFTDTASDCSARADEAASNYKKKPSEQAKKAPAKPQASKPAAQKPRAEERPAASAKETDALVDEAMRYLYRKRMKTDLKGPIPDNPYTRRLKDNLAGIIRDLSA